MNFDISGLMDAIRKEFGNFIATVFLAFLVFAVVIWILVFVIEDAALPFYSFLQELDIKEVSFKRVVRAILVIYLIATVFLLIKVKIRFRGTRVLIETMEDKHKKVEELLDELVKEKEALEEERKKFEEEKSKYKNQ